MWDRCRVSCYRAVRRAARLAVLAGLLMLGSQAWRLRKSSAPATLEPATLVRGVLLMSSPACRPKGSPSASRCLSGLPPPKVWQQRWRAPRRRSRESPRKRASPADWPGRRRGTPSRRRDDSLGCRLSHAGDEGSGQGPTAGEQAAEVAPEGRPRRSARSRARARLTPPLATATKARGHSSSSHARFA